MKKSKVSIIILLSFCSCSSLDYEAVNILSKRYESGRKVILTADDYGISENINNGIEKGIATGLINHVEAMVTFPDSINDIIALQEKFRDLEIGLHLSITSGYPVSDMDSFSSLINDEGEFYSIEQIITKLGKIDLDELELELRSQINEMLDHNIKVASISSQHNILGIYTPFFNIVLKLSKEYNIPLRSTLAGSVALKQFDYAKTRVKGKKLASKVVRKNFFLALKYWKYFKHKEMLKNQKRMDEAEIKHPDYIIDAFWGEPTPENLFYILTNLPEGISEIVFHLGLNEKQETSQPGIDMNYYSMREYELMVVTSPEMKRWLDDLNIEINGYNDL